MCLIRYVSHLDYLGSTWSMEWTCSVLFVGIWSTVHCPHTLFTLSNAEVRAVGQVDTIFTWNIYWNWCYVGKYLEYSDSWDRYGLQCRSTYQDHAVVLTWIMLMVGIGTIGRSLFVFSMSRIVGTCRSKRPMDRESQVKDGGGTLCQSLRTLNLGIPPALLRPQIISRTLALSEYMTTAEEN